MNLLCLFNEKQHTTVSLYHVITGVCNISSQGAGTEEAGLIDILASRTNAEIKTINAFYKKGNRVASAKRNSDIRSWRMSESADAYGLCMTSDIVKQ